MKYQTKKKTLIIVGMILLVLLVLNLLLMPSREIGCIISLVLVVAYLILVIIWQRCPYCNRFIRFGNCNHCPYCGKDLTEE